MKLNLDQLNTHLKNPLAPIYCLSGDEVLLLEEAQQSIRNKALDDGYDERYQYTVSNHFDWQSLLQKANNLSLFSSRQLIELVIPNGKPGETGAKQLIAYAEKPLSDTVLMIISGKLDASSQRSKWYKAIQENGVVIPIWPVDRRELPNWLKQRMRQSELTCDPEGLILLAERVEGNLLAAAQEIEKLRLLHGSGHLTTEQIAASVSDSSRFDIFKLVDSILLGEKNRILHMLQGLRDEGTEPTLVLWAISREYRNLAQISYGLKHGKSMKQCCEELSIWSSRQSILQNAVKNKSPTYFHHLLQKAHEIDCMIKGAKAGDVWLSLLALGLFFKS